MRKPPSARSGLEALFRHKVMNRIYRLVWSCTQQAWVPVSEISGGLARGGNKSTRSKLLVASLTLCTAVAQANPSGGVVTAGAGSIAQTANTTTIHQNSQNLSLNWNSFNIATNQIVNFVQPSASAIAVNRIFDTSATQILGQLNANGQVYLINPNGIVFGQGSQVNVGGLVASTLDVNDASLNSNSKTFSGTGTGSIINKGNLVAANGGYIALLANQVSNQGIISAQLGTVALAGGPLRQNSCRLKF
jgi:filamentous hemagglutinin family protein